MPKTPTPPARDPAKPPAFYLKLVKLQTQAVRAAARLDSAGVLTSTTNRHLQMAAALYSAGAPVKECVAHLTEASRVLTKAFTRSAERPIAGIPDVAVYVEAMSGSRIAGLHDELVHAYRRASFGSVQPWQRALLDGIAAALTSGGGAIAKADARGAPAEYGPHCFAMLEAVTAQDHASFPDRLTEFLLRDWAPVAQRRGRGELRAANSMYVGMWSFLAPAMCDAMGALPPLPEPAARYVPLDLLDAPLRAGHGTVTDVADGAERDGVAGASSRRRKTAPTRPRAAKSATKKVAKTVGTSARKSATKSASKSASKSATKRAAKRPSRQRRPS